MKGFSIIEFVMACLIGFLFGIAIVKVGIFPSKDDETQFRERVAACRKEGMEPVVEFRYGKMIVAGCEQRKTPQ